MGHKSVRLLIEAIAKKLGDNIQFTYGRTSDFNAIRDKQYPFITLDPIRATSGFAVNESFNYSKVWNVLMAFYGLDRADSTEDEYKLILDDTDILVDRFVIDLNNYSSKPTDADITVRGFSQEPFIKATADILTGYSLSFQIIVPDDWEYCINGC